MDFLIKIHTKILNVSSEKEHFCQNQEIGVKKINSQLFPHLQNHIIKPIQISNKLLIIRYII